MDMEKPRPKVGIGIYIVDGRGNLLMILRKTTHEPGTWCPPGGHLEIGESFLECCKREVKEEVGLNISEYRLKYDGLRQLAGTLSAHKAHLYSVCLNTSELEWLKSQKGIPHGADLDNPTGERAYTEIWTLRELLKNNLTDWSNVGMILSLFIEKWGGK